MPVSMLPCELGSRAARRPSSPSGLCRATRAMERRCLMRQSLINPEETLYQADWMRMPPYPRTGANASSPAILRTAAHRRACGFGLDDFPSIASRTLHASKQ